MYSLFVDERTKEEIREAFEYYQNINGKVAEGFITELENAFETLGKIPHFQIRYKTYRCLPFKRFPFMLHFTIDEVSKVVDIFALIHTSQNPNQYWVKEPDLEYNINAMRHLQVSIPDSFYNSFVEFLKQEPKAKVSEEKFPEIPESVHTLVKMRHKTAKPEDYITAEESIKRLKRKLNV